MITNVKMEITINQIYIALTLSLIPAFFAFKLGNSLNK